MWEFPGDNLAVFLAADLGGNFAGDTENTDNNVNDRLLWTIWCDCQPDNVPGMDNWPGVVCQAQISWFEIWQIFVSQLRNVIKI